MNGIKVLLIDAMNLIRRVHAAHPEGEDPQGMEGPIVSCVHSLERSLHECLPSHAICVFEGRGKSWRNDLFAGYKSGRQPMPDILRENLVRFKEAFEISGVKSIEKDGIEADDIIATLARKIASQNGHVIILSTDKIFLQLLSDHIRVRDHFKRAFLDESHVRERFGIRPGQLVDLLSLAGDSTNTIPGVPGIGQKTAAGLLKKFSTLESVLDNRESITGKTGNLIAEHAPEALLAKRLIRLREDIEMGLNLRLFRYQHG
ncbi:MAG TPA: flap endonuclease Xni [Deltaproteobacteria bacterium]|nr:flap endonuclease Xni [Deltaproteobacteria bacterium]